MYNVISKFSNKFSFITDLELLYFGCRWDDCEYGFDSVFLLDDVEITDDIALKWPCALREHWNMISPLVELVRGLLHYGTAITVGCGLLLNFLAFIVLISPRMQRQTTNTYLAALAVFDACVLVFNFMVGVLRGQNQDPINKAFQDNEWLCLLHSVVVELFNLLSVWMIVCFTVERCIAVYLPLKASTLISKKKTRGTVIGITVFLLAFSLHKLFVSGFEGDSVFGYKACITNRKKYPEAIFFYVAFNTALPTIAIIVLNSMIIFKVNQSQKIRKAMSRYGTKTSKGDKTAEKQAKRDTKVTKTLLVISSAYIILVLPLGITQMVELYWNNVRKEPPSADDPEQQLLYIDFMKRKHLLKWIRAFFFFFYQLNFAINFFLYILSTAKFRKELQSKFCIAPLTRQASGSQATGMTNADGGRGMSSKSFTSADSSDSERAAHKNQAFNETE